MSRRFAFWGLYVFGAGISGFTISHIQSNGIGQLIGIAALFIGAGLLSRYLEKSIVEPLRKLSADNIQKIQTIGSDISNPSEQ